MTLIFLLFGIVVIIKVTSFSSYDKIYDLLWLIVLGSIAVKGLSAYFPKKKNENFNETINLYLKLFGKFVFIAADIPIIIIFFTALLAYIFPMTPVLRAIVWGLLAFSVGYAIWFRWYTSKNRKLLPKSDTLVTNEFCTEQKTIWKHSHFWVNTIYGITGAMLVFYFTLGDPIIYRNNSKLKEAFTNLNSGTITLEETVPFEWTRVYTFDPYTPLEYMEQFLFAKSPALKESVSEGMINIVFMNHHRVVASVCAYPSSLGYSLDSTGVQTTCHQFPEFRYTYIGYGEEITFQVAKADEIVQLSAFISE